MSRVFVAFFLLLCGRGNGCDGVFGEADVLFSCGIVVGDVCSVCNVGTGMLTFAVCAGAVTTGTFC